MSGYTIDNCALAPANGFCFISDGPTDIDGCGCFVTVNGDWAVIAGDCLPCGTTGYYSCDYITQDWFCDGNNLCGSIVESEPDGGCTMIGNVGITPVPIYCAFSEYCSAPPPTPQPTKCLSYDEKTAIELIGQARNTLENGVTLAQY